MKRPLHNSCKWLLALCFAGYLPSATAQQAPAALPAHCGTDKAMQALYRQHPASQQAAGKLEAFTRSFVQQQANHREAAPGTYIIPVVFHVNDPVNPYKVTAEQIRSAIDILNEDYNALNTDFAGIDPRFKPIAANIGIQFRLADIDPAGNPTNGVTYHQNDLDGRAPDGSGRAVKSISYWPGDKYLNIWIVSEVESKGVFNNSGWSYLPDDWVANQKLDGIVYNWRYLGRGGVGSSEAGQPHMKRVLSHEVGHFLNLDHTFNNECAAPGDNVDDTPPTKSNFGGCDLQANSCGVIANVENYMDYSSCAKMFTLGQKNRMLAALNSTIAKRNNLWSPANLAATLILQPTKRIIFSTLHFTEQDTNDGSIAGTATLKAIDGIRFNGAGTTLVNGTHYTVQNVPAGLTVQLQVQNDSTATLSFTGKAQQHDSAQSLSNLRFTFLAPALQGGVSGLFNPSSILSITYLTPYRIVYKDVPDIDINAGNNWTYFEFGVGDAAYGGWLDNGKLRLEAYQKAIVCENGTRNITPLAANTLINASAGFVAGGAYPNEHDVYSSTYTRWAGQTAYAGIRFTVNGKARYGWIRMSVSADGKRLVIKDYAYNEAPEAGIRAGEVAAPLLSWSGTTFRENAANNGQISDTAEISLLGNTFAVSSGNFSANVHYTVSNVPAGLTVQIKVLNNNTARLSFSGTATRHTAADNASNITLQWLSAAFSSGTVSNAAQVLGVSFRDPYQIKYVDTDDATYTVNGSNNWYYFRLEGAPNAEYGLWSDNGALRLETYKKPMVSNGTTRQLTLLPANTQVSAASNFVPGGDYPDEHDLHTSSYTTWKGQTGYAGFSFSDQGDTYYGWFRFRVSADGTSYTMMDYAYNTQPGAMIKTGPPVTPGNNDTTAQASAYCAAATALNYNHIKQVKFGSINNASAWTSYADYTTKVARVSRGQSYPLQVMLNIESWPDIAVAVWIDWNGDKVFQDPAERVYNKRGSGPFSTTVTVPANAVSGALLMRVRTGYGQNINACGTDTYQGEVEDYTVLVGSAGSREVKVPSTTLWHGMLKATNPFKDAIQLWYEARRNGQVILRITDLQGRTLRQQPAAVIKGENVLRIEGLSVLVPGIYLLDVKEGDQHTQLKLVK